MNTFDKAWLQELESRLRKPETWAPLKVALAAAKRQHNESNEMWLTSPLTLNVALPPELKSCRITVFSPGADTKIERHPNAVQIVRILEGQCNIRTRANEEDEWDAHPMYSSAGNLYQRWKVVQPNVWHCPAPMNDSGWSMLAFHTVPAHELIDETP